MSTACIEYEWSIVVCISVGVHGLGSHDLPGRLATPEGMSSESHGDSVVGQVRPGARPCWVCMAYFVLRCSVLISQIPR